MTSLKRRSRRLKRRLFCLSIPRLSVQTSESGCVAERVGVRVSSRDTIARCGFSDAISMRWREKHEGFAGQRLVVVPRPVLANALRDPLLRPLLPSDAGYYPKAKGHTCARERGCPEAIFIYCADGSGWCELSGRRHDVAKNQLLVIPASAPHVYGAAKKTPWTIHWFHAVGSNVPFYLERLGVTEAKPVVPLGGDVQLFSLFEEVLEELEHGFTLTHLIYAAHSLTHLMGLILRHKEEFGHGETHVRERIAKSIEFMKGHLQEPLNIATLA